MTSRHRPEDAHGGMAHALGVLYSELRSDDVDVRDDAAFQAGRLLELHFVPVVHVNVPDYYESVIRPELLSRPLSDAEQEDLVAYLHETLLRSRRDPSRDGTQLLAAMAHAKPWIVAPRFVDLLLEDPGSYSENELHMLVHGLDQCLFLDHTDPMFPNVRDALMRSEITSVLHEVTKIPPTHDNSCMPEDAQRILDELSTA